MVPSIRQSRSMPHSGQKIRWKQFRPWIPMDMEPLWPGWHVEARMWQDNFIGAAPFSEIAVVKLKEAKTYLREFYFIPDSVPAYQENDIMMAVSYLDRLAKERDMPLVICIALGSNMGNRGKDGQLATYLDIVSRRRKRCSRGSSRKRGECKTPFSGKTHSRTWSTNRWKSRWRRICRAFSLSCGRMRRSFMRYLSCSPTGEDIAKSAVSQRWQTGVSVYFRADERQHRLPADRTGGRETSSSICAFQTPTQGIWTVNVYPQSIVTGDYNMWLPMRKFTGVEMFFSCGQIRIIRSPCRVTQGRS